MAADIKTQEQLQAHAMIKKIFEDSEAEINGNKYKLTSLTHKQRRKVFAFYTTVTSKVKGGDLSFLDSEEFEAIESIVNKSTTFEGSLLSVLGDAHWEANPNDYVVFISTVLPVISYPFMGANATG